MSHTACREQARTDNPVGYGAQVEHRGAISGKADNEQFAQDRGLRTQRGPTYILWQRFADYGQFLADNLTRQIDIGIPVELHPHHREAHSRGRADAAYTCGAIDCGFDREGHQLFHLFGGHASSFGHHHNGGGIEVGEDIHFGVEGGVDTSYQEQHGGHQHQEAVVERKVDDFIQHSFILPLINVRGYGRGWHCWLRPTSPDRHPLPPRADRRASLKQSAPGGRHELRWSPTASCNPLHQLG